MGSDARYIQKAGRAQGGRAVRRRWITDLARTVILLPLMGCSQVGEAVPKRLDVLMVIPAALPQVWNRTWFKGQGKGKVSL